jgi:hypothetical protein
MHSVAVAGVDFTVRDHVQGGDEATRETSHPLPAKVAAAVDAHTARYAAGFSGAMAKTHAVEGGAQLGDVWFAGFVVGQYAVAAETHASRGIERAGIGASETALVEVQVFTGRSGKVFTVAVFETRRQTVAAADAAQSALAAANFAVGAADIAIIAAGAGFYQRLLFAAVGETNEALWARQTAGAHGGAIGETAGDEQN